MPGQYVMQNQLVADFATSVVSDSLSPLDFMLTGEEARIRQARPSGSVSRRTAAIDGTSQVDVDLPPGYRCGDQQHSAWRLPPSEVTYQSKR
jgi:hypothetical protein